MILLTSFFTQEASGSRQTSRSEFFRVALQDKVNFEHQQDSKYQIIFSVTRGMRWRTAELGLTWSPSRRSESWQESAPLYWYGGQCFGSLSGCSGSAAPLPDFFCFLCFFLQETAHAYTLWSYSVATDSGCIEEKTRIMHESKLVVARLTAQL